MAAAVSAWAKPGVWALDSDDNEEELLHQHKQDVAISKGADTADFPSLATAASTKSKKKTPHTISLQEFATYDSGKPAQSEAPKGLTPDELLLLPTGPRQRSPEDLERNKLGVDSDPTDTGMSSRADREASIGIITANMSHLGLTIVIDGRWERSHL